MANEPITVGQIKAKKLRYERKESAFRADCRIDQDFLHSTLEWWSEKLAPYVPGFPLGYIIKALPYAKIAVESAKNTSMAGEVPDVHDSLSLAEGEEPTKEQTRDLKETQRFDELFLTEVALRTSSNPFSEALRKVYGLGPGILAFQWLEEVWKADNDAWSWLVEVIHPLNIWPDPFHNPPQDYITEDKLEAAVAAELYPDIEVGEQDEVTRLIYCSEQWYYVEVNGQAVFKDGEDGVVPNPMGMLWYELALSGLGETREDGDPVSLWQGLVRPLREAIAMKITNLNLREAAKFKEVLSPLQFEAENEDEAEALIKRFKLGPLTNIGTTAGVKIHPIFTAGDDRSLSKEDADLDRFMEVAMGTQLQSGNYSQDQTASGLAQRVSLQQAPYEAGKVGVEQAVANMLRKVRQFYKTRYGEPGSTDRTFTLGGRYSPSHKFNPDHLLVDCMTVIEMKPTTAADRAMSKDTDMAEAAAGHISEAEYRRRQNIENGKEQDDEWFEEQMDKHPKVLDVAAMVIGMALQQKFMPEQPVPAGAPAEKRFAQESSQNGSATGALTKSMVPAGPGGF